MLRSATAMAAPGVEERTHVLHSSHSLDWSTTTVANDLTRLQHMAMLGVTTEAEERTDVLNIAAASGSAAPLTSSPAHSSLLDTSRTDANASGASVVPLPFSHPKQAAVVALARRPSVGYSPLRRCESIGHTGMTTTAVQQQAVATAAAGAGAVQATKSECRPSTLHALSKAMPTKAAIPEAKPEAAGPKPAVAGAHREMAQTVSLAVVAGRHHNGACVKAPLLRGASAPAALVPAPAPALAAAGVPQGTREMLHARRKTVSSHPSDTAPAASPRTPRVMQSPVSRQRKLQMATMLSAFDNVFAKLTHPPDAAEDGAEDGEAGWASEVRPVRHHTGKDDVAAAAAMTRGPVYRAPSGDVASILGQGGDASLAAPQRRSTRVSVYYGSSVGTLAALGADIVPRSDREGSGLYVHGSAFERGQHNTPQLLCGDKLVAVRTVCVCDSVTV